MLGRSCLEFLDLSWNRLRGASSLFAALKVNSTLKQLLLSHSSLGGTEAKCLSQALTENRTLELLDLSANTMDDEAAGLLSLGLTSNPTLRVLKLVYNPMTNTGALSLLKAALSNKSALENLDISSVFVNEDFVEMLTEARRRRRPALDVQHSAMSFVTRNLTALQVFKESLAERNMSVMDFFKALDKEGSRQVSTADFRKAVKEANLPLDQHQLGWLVRKFDGKCTCRIAYSQFADI
ncbi:leucine-rich repeat-containing protein 74A-like [Salarias fasciatus]|uniref:leucine-rich repeat-containing protein 74A-like n=1 Tax=Salarias fasciatus TaxID=181472 RepID=UPI001176FB85|nr:leucine-rich repeat-containing protein 74A-like [Salarias fasciatus]